MIDIDILFERLYIHYIITWAECPPILKEIGGKLIEALFHEGDVINRSGSSWDDGI